MILYDIEQTFPGEKVQDISQVIHDELANNERLHELPQGASVAITAGSRGIDQIVTILREIVRYVKDQGYEPFIIPSMGSHGGATADGQVDVLHHLGITEESVRAPIRSSMEVVELGTTDEDLPVYMDKLAFHADGIIIVNRVKAHTAFRGRIESGLSKMVAIGLGKQKGASFAHSQGANMMEQNIIEVTKYALDHAPICMGLAIVENGYDETAVLKGVDVDRWFDQESALLKQSKELMPTLPLDEADILIVEEMGKNYSGTGMDPNIIGRWRIDGVDEPERPYYKRVAVLDLSDESFGNAQGIGLADFTTDTFIQKIDRQATYMNAITSTFLRRVMFPLHYPTEEAMMDGVFLSLGPDVDPHSIRLMQIPNTLHLNRLLVSRAALHMIKQQNIHIEIIGEKELTFERGQLKYRLLKSEGDGSCV